MRRMLGKRWRTIGLLGLGAALMFLVDPHSGRRRRAYIRDKTRHSFRATQAEVTRIWTRVSNRTHGLAATTRRLFEPAAPPEDDILVARVRARIGHLVSHPHTIEVTADRGRVSVAGNAPAAEARKLLRAVACVRGVSSIDSHLELEAKPSAELTH